MKTVAHLRTFIRWPFATISGASALALLGLPGTVDDVSAWSRWLSWLDSQAALAGVLLVAVLGTVRWRRVKESVVGPEPVGLRIGSLTQIAHGQIRNGWFVTFTTGVFVTERHPHGRAATAIAEVVKVDGADVELQWRDDLTLPRRVPIALLDASTVTRVRGGRRTSSPNNGLQASNGSTLEQPGWSSHYRTPFKWVQLRARELDTDQRTAFEAEADLSAYVVA